MKKQTKIVAVLSASAMFAMSVSITAMAAGWVEENGVWSYQDRDGDPVTDEWRRSGSEYFWLDENGEMAVNSLIDDGDYKYFAGENGARVVNAWRQVDNEDGWTNGDNDEEPESIWYYFNSTGKAVTGRTDINGRVYIFDEEGEMFYGWTEFNEYTFYLGEENEGWAYTGWHRLELPEEIADNDEYEDDDAWFYFRSNGRMRKANDGEIDRVYINGAYYGFDENGVMVDGWVPEDQATATSSAYYSDESGAQRRGWVHTYPNIENGDDEDLVWFYLNSRGKPFNVGGYYDDASIRKSEGTVQKYEEGTEADLPVSEVAAKVISSRTYLFDNTGKMLEGVYEITTDFVDRVGGSGNLEAGVYYFNKEDGSMNGRMETGKQMISYDGENYYYHFQNNGAAYRNIVVDNSLYNRNGVRINGEDGRMLYTIGSDLFEDDILVRNSDTVLQPGDTVIVSTSGKLVRNGTTSIDGTRYRVENYVVDMESID